jgi:hypothetical protein
MFDSQPYKKIEKLISYIPLLYIIFLDIMTIYSMATKGIFGTYSTYIFPYLGAGFGSWELGRTVRGYSILGVSVIYLYLFLVLYKDLRPIIRMWASGLMAFTGLMWFEFWWILGGWLVFGNWHVKYWIEVLIAYVIGIYVTHVYFGILKISKIRIIISMGMFISMLLLWRHTITSGWYQEFWDWVILYDSNPALDPHGWVNLVIKELGIFTPIVFCSRR